MTYDPDGAGAGEADRGRCREEEGPSHEYGLFMQMNEVKIDEGLNAKWQTQSALQCVPRQIKMLAWLVWTCGELVNKFRDSEMHFPSSWSYVTHAYKFEVRWCI